MTTFTIPFPPSTNKLWRSGRRKSGQTFVYASDEYRAWKEQASWEIKRQKLAPIKGHYSIVITLDKSKRKSNSDCDNRIKAVNDLLQSTGIIENDSLADLIAIGWGPVRECLVHVNGRK